MFVLACCMPQDAIAKRLRGLLDAKEDMHREIRRAEYDAAAIRLRTQQIKGTIVRTEVRSSLRCYQGFGNG